MSIESRSIKIALVDDHSLIRDALALVINNFENCQVILVAGDGETFIEMLQPNNLPDMVIMDLNMPKMDGYETTKWLKNNHPDVYVLILTMYDSDLALLRLLQWGARGFLKKDIHPGELKFAIDSTMKTGYYYSNNVTGKMANMLKNGDLNAPLLGAIILSENEVCFLKLASTDKTYKEIAKEMKISPRTIDNYRDSLFIKLNVKSRVGLVMHAIKNGIISPGY